MRRICLSAGMWPALWLAGSSDGLQAAHAAEALGAGGELLGIGRGIAFALPAVRRCSNVCIHMLSARGHWPLVATMWVWIGWVGDFCWMQC